MALAAVLLPVSAHASDYSRLAGDALADFVRQDCGACHGMTLKGGLGRPLTQEALADQAPDALASIILDGIPGTAMPPWRPLLSEDEALWMANYLKKGTTQ